jgi:hypothetical protein
MIAFRFGSEGFGGEASPGHRSIASFKVYLHPTRRGSMVANQRMNCLGDFYGNSGNTGN